MRVTITIQRMRIASQRRVELNERIIRCCLAKSYCPVLLPSKQGPVWTSISTALREIT